jgi:transcriptional regulator with XRE-family HTH domain
MLLLFLSENLKKYRVLKGLTQEDVAEYLSVTPQSVSKWERGESYPDITFLPALANIFETSIDLLIGMDTIRAEKTRWNIHKEANLLQRNGDYDAAEKVYRDALLIYPNKPGMIIGLAGVLALRGKSEEAIELMERGLPLSINEKQKATTRAALCFLYLKCGKEDKANALAASLPHTRESREVIQPLIAKGLADEEINLNIRNLLLGSDQEVVWMPLTPLTPLTKINSPPQR